MSCKVKIVHILWRINAWSSRYIAKQFTVEFKAGLDDHFIGAKYMNSPIIERLEEMAVPDKLLSGSLQCQMISSLALQSCSRSHDDEE